MKPIIPLFAACFVFAACQPAGGSDEGPDNPAPATGEAVDTAGATGAPDAPVRLIEQWQASGFSAPEGVAAAPGGGYFISNVAGNGDEKDGAGWVSKISESGTVESAEFAAGMDAPKGMAVDRGILYVADLDRVHLVDPDEGTLHRSIAVEGAEFLNDVTAWNAAVFIADSGTGRIYRLSGDAVDVWLEDERLAGVNGLTPDGDRLLVSTMGSGSLYAVTADRTLTEIAAGMTNADGVGRVDGGYLVSSWPGQIWFVSETGGKTEILNTRDNGIFQNDLTVFGNTVIVPNWMPGTVTAWRIEANQAGGSR